MTPEQISAWPGKMIDWRPHPTLWHMLDVGAVATCLMTHRSLTGSDARDQAAAFLVVLHDLGKFSASFRAMLRDQSYWGLRHWQHSYRLLRDHDEVLGKVIGATTGLRKLLYAAVAGHHGGPPAHLDHHKHKDQAEQIGAEASGVAREAIEAVAPLFPKASLVGLTESEACRLSWVLSGLTVQADWIGSNPEWFPSQQAGTPVASYWYQALARADTAISEAGCQGRSKSRPRWRRKSRPPSRWGGVAEGGLRTPGRLRGAGPSCCGQDDSSRRSAPGCGRDGSAGRAGRRSAVRSRRSPSIR